MKKTKKQTAGKSKMKKIKLNRTLEAVEEYIREQTDYGIHGFILAILFDEYPDGAEIDPPIEHPDKEEWIEQWDNINGIEEISESIADEARERLMELVFEETAFEAFERLFNVEWINHKEKK